MQARLYGGPLDGTAIPLASYWEGRLPSGIDRLVWVEPEGVLLVYGQALYRYLYAGWHDEDEAWYWCAKQDGAWLISPPRPVP